jgi:hypothetical protein
MAIKSEFHLPARISGHRWSAELLPKVGKRNNMLCIYKLRLDGDSKRAGVYLKENLGPSFRMDIAGSGFHFNIDTRDLIFPAYTKYSQLQYDDNFKELVELTIAHFGGIELDSAKPMPKVEALTDEEAEGIDAFGVF